MYLPSIELEIKGSLLSVKELKAIEAIKEKAPFWIRNKKLPYTDKEEVNGNPANKQKGMPPAFVSNFYLERMIADSSDVLGAIASGDLANQVSSMVHKDCYLLPKQYPNLPLVIKDELFIWLPPAACLAPATDKNTFNNAEIIAHTFTDYCHRLTEFYIMLPKNFLTDKKIKKLRQQILSKTSYALILKYKSFFNAVLLKITRNADHESNIPCKIFTEPDNTGFKPTEAYKLYFKHLAAEFCSDDPVETNWVLTTDGQKTNILPKVKAKDVIGDYITITGFNRKKQINELPEKSLLKKAGIYYVTDKTSLKSIDTNINNLDNGENESINTKEIGLQYNQVELSNNDLIIKARAPLRVETAPSEAVAVLLPNHYYIVKLKPELLDRIEYVDLMDRIKNSIIKFYNKHEKEIDCLGTISFELLRQIPLQGE